MAEITIKTELLQQAIESYLKIAYPTGNIPEMVRERIGKVMILPAGSTVPESCFEVTESGGHKIYALRLGQPSYPHMKLIVEECPTCRDRSGTDHTEPVPVLFRADAHDSHLQVPSNSPDAAPLAALRAINKQMTEAIEAAWVTQGLPTFQEFLRQELARRKGNASHQIKA